MVRIDSRSFSVNEFEGDRKTPSDMKDILENISPYKIIMDAGNNQIAPVENQSQRVHTTVINTLNSKNVETTKIVSI